MSWTVYYMTDARADFRKMDLDVAERICRAVHAVADARSTRIESDPDDPTFVTIPAEGGFATVTFDMRTKVLIISRLVADKPFDPGVALLDEPESPPSSDP